MWSGTWRGLPGWFVTLFKCLGIGLWCLAATFAAIGLWQAVPGPTIAGTIHSFLGFVLFPRLKRRFDSSMTAEEAAKQLGVEVEAFEQLVEEKQIRPTHLYNNEPIYDLASLGDVGVLLRAASRPEPESTLLRPAGGRTDAPTDHLLRSSAEPGSEPATLSERGGADDLEQTTGIVR